MWANTEAGDAGLIPGLGRSPGFLLENPVDRGAWWAILHGVTKSQTQLSMHVLLLCSNRCLTESKKKRKKH